MSEQFKQYAPWWLGLALALVGAVQQVFLQQGGAESSINREMIQIMVDALRECQAGPS